MYGQKEQTFAPRLTLNLSNLSLFALVIWLLFGEGLAVVSGGLGLGLPTADLTRRTLLVFCSGFYFIRVAVTTFVLLKRKMGWGECLTIIIWLLIVHILFAILGGTRKEPVGLYEIVGVGLYLIGSYLNTGSEYMRKLWKEGAANKGRLYTGGLFKYSMHINYFGDVVLFTGIALVTGSFYAFIIPALMTILFSTVNIPMLDKYLAVKYGGEFDQYRKSTKKFVPFLY